MTTYFFGYISKAGICTHDGVGLEGMIPYESKGKAFDSNPLVDYVIEHTAGSTVCWVWDKDNNVNMECL